MNNSYWETEFQLQDKTGFHQQLERFAHESFKDWARISGADLSDHIIQFHFNPNFLFISGIARFDIEVAAARGLDLSAAVDYATRQLERGFDYGFPFTTPQDYRIGLAMNLKYIEQQCNHPVNLKQFDLPAIPCDPDRYSADVGLSPELRNQLIARERRPAPLRFLADLLTK